MNILRRLPLSRLLLTCAAVLVVGASAALATTLSAGPKPAPQPLPNAIHDALAAAPVQGVSAQISFSNHLVDAASLQGNMPVLTGASGRVWLAKDGRVRLELQSNRGDTQIFYDGKTLSYFDSSTSTLYRLAMAQGGGGEKVAKPAAKEAQQGPPTVTKIQQALTSLMGHADVSRAIPSDVAGRPTYRVSISPSHAAGLLGAAQLEWDSVHGVPLRIAVYAADRKDPVLELKATSISYRALPASTFAVPSARKVVNIMRPATGADAAKPGHSAKTHHRAQATGPRAVQAALPFKLSAPAKLDGLPLRQVSLLDWNGSPAALVTYGQSLGGIVVVERQAKKATAPSAGVAAGADAQVKQAHGDTPSLPRISVNGTTGTELATALGTFLTFDRAGVSYTVLGSVPPVAAEAAARGL